MKNGGTILIFVAFAAVFILKVLFDIGVNIYEDSFEDDKISDENFRESIYDKTAKFINAIYTEDSDPIYEEYFSNEVKDEAQVSEWRYEQETLLENELLKVASFNDLQEGNISKTYNIIGEKPPRYTIEMDVTLEAEQQETAEATFEWVEEDDELMLYAMEFPIEFESDRVSRWITFGID